MAAPAFTPFKADDFPDQPWLSKLFLPLNTFLQAIAAGLKNLTFGDNFNAEIRKLDIANGQLYPIKVKLQKQSLKPIGVLAIAAIEKNANPSKLTNAPFVNWTLDADSSGARLLMVNSVANLDTAKSYSLTMLILGG